MAELITGRGGTDHVDSEDFGAFNAVTLGDGTYILSGCSMAMKTATTLHIAAGELLMQGRHVRIKGPGEDVDVAVGTTGYNRNDIVALHYKQEGGIESVSVEVVAGTPTTGAASDPELGGGSILNGDAEAYAAIARVPIAGLAPSEPVVLVGGLKSNSQLAESISALGDSVSPKTLVDGQIKSGESRTVHGIADWLVVGVYASAAAGDSDDREMLIPCLVGDRFLLGSSGCAVDGSNPRYVSVRFSLNGEVLKYVNVTMQDTENGNILNNRNANGVVGLIRR